MLLSLFFFSSRRRHTRCALVTGVQTCALPISGGEIIRFTDKLRYSARRLDRAVSDIAPDCMRLVALPAVFEIVPCRELGVTVGRAAICLCDVESDFPFGKRIENGLCEIGQTKPPLDVSIGRASCRERVCQYV